MPVPTLILASASPRRRELVALLGLPFRVMASRYEEPSAPASPVDMAAFVTELATRKAEEVVSRLQPPHAAQAPAGSAGGPDRDQSIRPEGPVIVLAADTEVSLETDGQGTPLGKPQDAAAAREMLRRLADRTHAVFTGVALYLSSSNGHWTGPFTTAEQTLVRFRALTDAMIADYVATGEPLDKAGAYGAQGYAAPFIESFEGDFFNVVGLPLCSTGRLLESAGIDWWKYRASMPPIIG